MDGFVLRVKSKAGQKVVNGLTPEKKVSELKIKLADLTGIPINALHILCGFPPKPIDLYNEKITIGESGIVSGDTLIVEEKLILHNGEKPTDIGRSHVMDVEDDDTPGILLRKVVPPDNSCLFTSVGYVLNGKVDPTCGQFMRNIIANTVAADPEEYSEAILGKPNSEYCKWILKPDSWGGAIELSILSKFYGLEIAVVDSINAIINIFGEDQHYAQRVFLIFDGIHYDPLYLERMTDDRIQTIFPAENKRILLEATTIAKQANSSHQFTDIQKFTLICNDCKATFRGEVAAQQHAKETGHINYGEVAALHCESSID